MDDAIKRALEVANRELRETFDAECDGFPVTSMEAERIAAAAIAAFLRALPEDTAYTMVPLPLALAAEVERAAGGGA